MAFREAAVADEYIEHWRIKSFDSLDHSIVKDQIVECEKQAQMLN